MMSQAEAAEHLGIGYRVYNKLEAGLQVMLSWTDVERLDPGIARLQPTAAELCFLARRRSGLTLKQVVRELDISAPYYLRLEREADGTVLHFWQTRMGFIFPVA